MKNLFLAFSIIVFSAPALAGPKRNIPVNLSCTADSNGQPCIQQGGEIGVCVSTKGNVCAVPRLTSGKSLADYCNTSNTGATCIGYQGVVGICVSWGAVPGATGADVCMTPGIR